METVNERLQDILLRRGVDWERYKGSETARLLRILASADAAALQILERRIERLGPIERQTFGNGLATSERLVKVREAIDQISYSAADIMQADLVKSLFDVAKTETAFQAAAFGRMSLNVDWVTPSATLLRAIVRSRPFEGRLLKEHTREWGAAKRSRVLSVIRDGLVLGQSVPDIVRRIRGTRANKFKDGVLEASRVSAERIVRTSISHVTNRARAEAYRANADILRGVKWLATLDTRTCEVCGSLDGRIFPVSTPRLPPEHFSCRCVMTPIVLNSAMEGATRAGGVPNSVNFAQWLKDQGAETQKDVLGPKRAALFRRGGLKLDGFVDKTGRTFTLEELRRREAEAFTKAGL